MEIDGNVSSLRPRSRGAVNTFFKTIDQGKDAHGKTYLYLEKKGTVDCFYFVQKIIAVATLFFVFGGAVFFCAGNTLAGGALVLSTLGAGIFVLSCSLLSSSPIPRPSLGGSRKRLESFIVNMRV